MPLKDYRINVRFDRTDARQQRVINILEHLNREQYGSRNAFAVNAICAYVDSLDQKQPEALTLEDIRRVFREEVQTLPLAQPIAKQQNDKPKTWTKALTEEQEQENRKKVMAAMELF